ncbi:hypothetical protein [Streptomyces sp. NPDC017941]|uniref:hypothetical protein n=1 Tax=Streptomyces sp. NPDC017941 TaxID=3365018 RepID=UPI0037B0CFF0
MPPSVAVAVAADRIGWEERRLIAVAPAFGLRLEWVNDESMCLGHPRVPSLEGYDALLVRSRSYTRGGLIATLAEAAAVRTLNTARAIGICQNKAALRTVLRSAGIPVADFRLVLSRRDFERCLTELLTMSAYGVPTVRGLLASLYVFTDRAVDRRELERAYLRFYRGHPFVRARRHTETRIPVPDPQAVLGSNFCDVSAFVDEDGGHLVVLAALDNLVKGAAGQAVQAANRRFGLPEETGLTMQPVMPA